MPTSAHTSAIDAFLQILAAHDVPYVFGNPGTTELPLNDSLAANPRLQYILGLHEVGVMGMAQGYAMASGKLGVVNVHISCGLGNSMGMLYNAWREGTPLLLTAGQQDRRLMMEEPILAGDMVSVARPWTKWAVEVQRAEDLPMLLRRAIQTALTPPTGPVFMSLPIDVQMASVGKDADLSPPRLPNRHVRPPRAALEQAAALLAGAKNPCILAGSRVTEADAVAELVKLAEALGAPVIAEPGTTHGRLAFPATHPLAAMGLPLWSPEIRDRLSQYDVALVAGMDLLRLYIYAEPSRAIPETLKLVHLDEDPYQIGKNYPVDVGLIGDTKAGLAELGELIAAKQSPGEKAAAEARVKKHGAEKAASITSLRQQIESERPSRPMTPNVFMEAIARVLPDDVAVIEEAVTTTNTMLERLAALKNTTGYFGHRGWALGWGIGVALGAKLAWPNRPVLGIIGDGAAQYGIQGLYSAVRHNIPVVFVVPNNAQYQILKVCGRQLDLPEARRDNFLGLDLLPQVDLVKLAQGFGMEACRVTEPDELSERIRAGFASGKPLLIDVPIDRASKGRLQYG